MIQCYAPTNEASIEDKNKFYDKLQSLVSKVPAHDLCLVIGDLNAKTGVDNSCKERIMGKHGCGECNENGGLLVDLCGLNDLVIGGSLFPHKDFHKLTWNSPNGRDQNQIDHIIVNGRWRKSLMDVCVKRGADCGSDHHLLLGKIKLELRKVVRPQNNRKAYNTHRLNDKNLTSA